MPILAENIEITDSGLKINGEEFPYDIAEGGVTLDSSGGMETLTLTLITGRASPAVETADHDPCRRDIEKLRAELTETRRAFKASQDAVCGLAEDLSEAQHRARKAETEVPQQDSMLDAAKLSLKEAERFEASAEEVERSLSNDCSVGSLDAERLQRQRRLGRDELLLANAQASIAVAEALASSTAPTTFGEAIADAQADVETTGSKIGTAYIEVRPILDAEDEEFKQTVRSAFRNALRDL